jgi:hypothetical protein
MAMDADSFSTARSCRVWTPGLTSADGVDRAAAVSGGPNRWLRGSRFVDTTPSSGSLISSAAKDRRIAGSPKPIAIPSSVFISHLVARGTAGGTRSVLPAGEGGRSDPGWAP